VRGCDVDGAVAQGRLAPLAGYPDRPRPTGQKPELGVDIAVDDVGLKASIVIAESCRRRHSAVVAELESAIAVWTRRKAEAGRPPPSLA